VNSLIINDLRNITQMNHHHVPGFELTIELEKESPLGPYKPLWIPMRQIDLWMVLQTLATNAIECGHRQRTLPKLKIRTYQTADGKSHIEFVDQGPGMSKPTLGETFCAWYDDKK